MRSAGRRGPVTWLVPFLFLIFSPVAGIHAQSAAQVPTIEHMYITEYGLYTGGEQSCYRDEQGVQRCEQTNIRHTETTLTVPARLGVHFGVRFWVSGTPDAAKVKLTRVWLFPDPGLKSPALKEPIHRREQTETVAIGSGDFTTYAFDDLWELVPGNWTLEYWQGDRKLLSETFTVVKE